MKYLDAKRGDKTNRNESSAVHTLGACSICPCMMYWLYAVLVSRPQCQDSIVFPLGQLNAGNYVCLLAHDYTCLHIVDVCIAHGCVSPGLGRVSSSPQLHVCNCSFPAVTFRLSGVLIVLHLCNGTAMWLPITAKLPCHWQLHAK